MVALVAMVAAVGFLLSFLILDFPVALIALGVFCVALAGVWFMLTRRGVLRAIGAVIAVVSFAGIIAVLVWQDSVLEIVGFTVSVVVAAAAIRFAQGTDPKTLQHVRVSGEPAPVPRSPVLIMNPWSGGGKVKRFDLVEESRRRGVEPVLLDRGLDLRELALDAVKRGADVLGMAGGDGSQAIVAQVAMEHRLPYVCVPAGTRNHLALDLGLDRDDVAGALDAYTKGIPRTIDLATINDHVFVNNVSLGIYAESCSRMSTETRSSRRPATSSRRYSGPMPSPRPRVRRAEWAHPSDGPADPRLEQSLPADDALRHGLAPPHGHGRARDRRARARVGARSRATRAGGFTWAHHALPGWHEWAAKTSRCGRANQSRQASTAKRSPTIRHFASASIPGALEIRIPPHAPGLSPAAATTAPSASIVGDLLRIAVGRTAPVPDA